MDPFSVRIIETIKQIPPGSVATYGQIAAISGNPRGARQVSRILHSCSEKENLPWHRVINSKGEISLPRGHGFEIQKERLLSEGIRFSVFDKIDLSEFLWCLG